MASIHELAVKRAPLPSDRVSDAYDVVAAHYDDTFNDHRCRVEDELLVGRLTRFLAGVYGRVIDLGCGTGAFLRLTGWDTDRYLGVDISAGMLAQAKLAHPDATFLHASIDALPLPDETFYAAVSLYSPLSYVAAPLDAMHEIHRVLHPCGRVLLIVYGPRWYRDGPQRCVRVDTFAAPAAWSCWQARARCEAAGFKNVRLSAFSMLPSWCMPWEGPLARWWPGWGRYLIIEASRS